MSSLILITGTIDEAEDPFGRLDISELYYESWEQDTDSPNHVIITREPVPLKFYGFDKFRIVQYLGSGKTLKGMDIICDRAYYGNRVAANLGLVWHNFIPIIQSIEDFKHLDHCTVLIDDIKGTILRWNVEEADIISEIANSGRKTGLDIIITAQREKMIPPEIRDMATEWIVPIIRVRDYTKKTPDGTGYPVEMICLHFDGAKVLKSISEPIINMRKLFDSYSTIAKAVSLKKGEDKPRTNQPGYELEVKAFEYLKEKAPAENWQHLNGKRAFDIISDVFCIDVCDMDVDGYLITRHKNLIGQIGTAKKTGRKPYLMFPYQGSSWGFIKITPSLHRDHVGDRIDIFRMRIKTLDDVTSNIADKINKAEKTNA